MRWPAAGPSMWRDWACRAPSPRPRGGDRTSAPGKSPIAGRRNLEPCWWTTPVSSASATENGWRARTKQPSTPLSRGPPPDGRCHGWHRRRQIHVDPRGRQSGPAGPSEPDLSGPGNRQPNRGAMRHEIAAKHAASRGSLSAGPCGCRRRRGSQSTLAARARGRPAAQGEPSGSTGRSSTFAAGSRRRRRLSSTSVTALPHGILTARLQKPVSAHPHQPLQCTRPARDRSRGLMQAAEWGWPVTLRHFHHASPRLSPEGSGALWRAVGGWHVSGLCGHLHAAGL